MVERKFLWRYDQQQMLAILRNFPEQCRQACSLQIPENIMLFFDKVCLVGMGGSAISLEVLKTIGEEFSDRPILVHRNYGLPSWVDQNWLVACCSYSGNTEEVVSAYQEARKRKCLLVVISSGGKLTSLATRDKVMNIKIPEGLPPRCAFGFLFFPLLRLFRKSGVLADSPSLNNLLQFISTSVKQYLPEKPNNPAQKLAWQLYGHVPVLYSDTEHFPAVLRWKQQLAENSKVFSTVGVLPEMNHNEIVSWRFPRWFVKKSLVLFFTGKPLNDRIEKRVQITFRIIHSRKKDILRIKVPGSSLLERLLRAIILGDWVSFYLALLNRVDPTEIKEIVTLKNFLSK